MRTRRRELFARLLSKLSTPIRILDVGGTEDFWETTELGNAPGISITLLNVDEYPTALPNVTNALGDARDLHYADASFDVVFSNSVIEHVGSFADQEKMAREIRRVASKHFIQTPNRYFPIEPHFVFPAYQFLPRAIQLWLLQHYDLGWMPRTPDRAEAAEIISSIRLLDRREMRALFPRSDIVEEKLLGLTKSFIACGGWGLPPSDLIL